jgi:hypothetical protein
MAVTEHPSEIIFHMRTDRGGRKRSGSRALCIGVGKKRKLASIRKLTFTLGQLAQPCQWVDYVRDQLSQPRYIAE